MGIASKDYILDEWEYDIYIYIHVYIYGLLNAQHNNIRCFQFCLLSINQTKERKQQNGFLLWLEQKEKEKKGTLLNCVKVRIIISIIKIRSQKRNKFFNDAGKNCMTGIFWSPDQTSMPDTLTVWHATNWNYIPNHQPSGSTLVMVLWSAGGRNGRPVCKHQHHLRTTHTLWAFQLPVKNKWINLYQTQK